MPFYIIYVLAIAFLMASRIPHFSGKRIGRIPRDLVIPVLFGVGVTALLLAIYPMEVLVVVSVAFLAMIPLSVKRYNALTKAEAEKAQGSGERKQCVAQRTAITIVFRALRDSCQLIASGTGTSSTPDPFG